MLIGSVLMTIGTVGLLIASATVGGATLVAILVGIAVANIYPAGIALVVAAQPARADHVVARASVLLSVSVIIFPVFLGRLADAIGLHQAFLTVPVIALVAVAAVRLTGATRRPPVLPTQPLDHSM